MQANRKHSGETAAPLASESINATAFGRRDAGIVGFLTRYRRKVDGARCFGLAGSVLMGLAIAFVSQPSAASPSQWHSVDAIATAAEQYLDRHIGATDSRTTLKASQLDPRLQLPQCGQPLDAFLQRGTKMSSRMTVGVRCDGEKPWKVYVTVDVIVTEAVLVAARSLPNGHVLTAADVSLAERDVSSLRSGYLSTPGDIVGRRLKHGLIEGRVLTPAMMKEDVVIHRGQSVTLTIRSKSLNISMEGKALMDGSVNQRIRVQNSLSRRVVEGIVRSPQHVEVLVF